MNLSIFSFEKRQPRASSLSSSLESESSVAVLDSPEDQPSSQSMLLDLEHLTPEVLDAFFPSESTLPASAPRNPSKRRSVYPR